MQILFCYGNDKCVTERLYFLLFVQPNKNSEMIPIKHNIQVSLIKNTMFTVHCLYNEQNYLKIQ